MGEGGKVGVPGPAIVYIAQCYCPRDLPSVFMLGTFCAPTHFRASVVRDDLFCSTLAILYNIHQLIS